MARSALFSQFDFEAKDNREFERDLRILIAMDDTLRRQLLEHLPRWATAPQGNSQAREFAERAGASPSEVMSTLRCYGLFVRQMLESDDHDAPEQWVADLTEALTLSIDEAQQLSEALTPLAELPLDAIRSEFVRRQPGVFPEFDSIDTTVELRAIFEQPFVLGADPSRYEPRVQEMVPIISMALGTDTEEQFHVQMHTDDLRLVIDKLQATLREAEAVERVLQGAQHSLDSMGSAKRR